MKPETRRTAERLRLLLEDTAAYVDLLTEEDIDMLLSSLAKTHGLKPSEIPTGDPLYEPYR